MPGTLRLETALKHVPENNQIFWISNSEPFCIQTLPSTSTIAAWKPNPNNIATVGTKFSHTISLF